jgi:hypothetical protein
VDRDEVCYYCGMTHDLVPYCIVGPLAIMAPKPGEFPATNMETEKNARFALKWIDDQSAAEAEHHNFSRLFPLANARGALASLLGYYLEHVAKEIKR